jgi:hypothetical protein
MNLLAFAFHTVCELAEDLWRRATSPPRVGAPASSRRCAPSWDNPIATLAFVRPPPVLSYRHHPVTPPFAKFTADVAYRQNENCCAKLARSRLLILGIGIANYSCPIARLRTAFVGGKGILCEQQR